MKIVDLVRELGLSPRTGETGFDREVAGGYVGDLLSDVLAHGREGDIWVTLQIHENVVAVALVKDLAGVIVINGREPEEGTLEKAVREGIPVLVSEGSAFELVERLSAAGITGGRE